jgi:hypothetical protein
MSAEYQPNFGNRAVRRRIQQALLFVQSYVSTTRPQWLSSRYIDRYFGQGQKPLSRYLRRKLLICVDTRYNKELGQCKQYIACAQGREFLQGQLAAYAQPEVRPALTALKHLPELASGQFQYRDISQRLYHPVQNIRRDLKRQLLGQWHYLHTYDIVCSCPTLIMEYCLQLGSEEYPNAIRTYIDQRSRIRQRIAQECELTEQQVKQIILGLFQGAIISNYTGGLIYRAVGGDPARIAWLRQDLFLQELRADIRMCWSVIAQTQPRRTRTDRTGRQRRIPLTGRTKTAIYRDLERRVLDAVRGYLGGQDQRFFLEHDGWSCERPVDTAELVDFVREQTGFRIQIDYEFIGKNK